MILKEEIRKTNITYVLPLGVHVEDDSLIPGRVNDGPEGVLGDLSDLSNSGSGTRRVQARPHCRNQVSAAIPLDHILLP